MDEPRLYYHRRLPHYHPTGSVFFITFRLADSLPVHVAQELLDERDKELRKLKERLSGPTYRLAVYQLAKKYFGRFDSWLDRCARGPQWLKDEAIAQIVMREILALQGQRYRLLAFCVMANHVHLLIEMMSYEQLAPGSSASTTAAYPLAETLRLLKGRTARYCNQALGRTGAFWHHESYDHVVRDDKELGRIVKYIVENPVKAGLVDDWRQWRYTYVAPEVMDMMSVGASYSSSVCSSIGSPAGRTS